MSKILLRETYRSRYNRWEERRIEQFGFVNNLLSGLASVLLFWLCESALENKFCLPCLSLWAIMGAGILLFLSLASGLGLALSRLHNFRTVTQLIRKENDREVIAQKAASDKDELHQQYVAQENSLASEIENYKKVTKRLDGITWFLLYVQVTFFSCGLISLGAAVIFKIKGI